MAYKRHNVCTRRFLNSITFSQTCFISREKNPESKILWFLLWKIISENRKYVSSIDFKFDKVLLKFTVDIKVVTTATHDTKSMENTKSKANVINLSSWTQWTFRK